VAGALLALGCAAGTEPARQATHLAKTGGDGQSWYFDNALPLPYTVTALDAGDQPVPGVMVDWSVTAGAGSVDPVRSATDAAGMASTVHTLDPTSAVQSVTASSGGLPAVTFTAAATAPSTADSVAVRDDFFDHANVVVKVNGTVTWTWGGANFHSVTFGSGTPSSDTQTSGTYSLTFSTPGTFHYFCRVHGGMTGNVTVVH
jgi:plastocyanin